jgi:hypothetical protein
MISDVAELMEAKANESARPCGLVAAYCPRPGVCRSGGGVDGAEITAGWKKGAASALTGELHCGSRAKVRSGVRS